MDLIINDIDNLRDSEYAQEIVDQLLMEEIIMYNASHYLNDKIYICIPNSTLAQKKNDYWVVGWEIIKESDKIWFKLTCFKNTENISSQLEEYKVFLEAMIDVTKFISVKDVIPNNKPLKLLRNFKEYVRLVIFSFIIYDPEVKPIMPKESIKIKSITKGILEKEIHIKFCK